METSRPEKPTSCNGCNSIGFAFTGENTCEFCDGTFGGVAPEESLSQAEIMVAMYGSKLRPWQSEALKRLMEIDPKDLTLREERQRLKAETFVERYGKPSQLIEMKTITVDSIPKTLSGVSIDYAILDEAHMIKEWCYSEPAEPKEEKDWARTKFKRSSTSSTPSAAKRANLRAKRKKRK